MQTIQYIYDIAVNHMMIPGRVENWVTILDLDNRSISDIPKKVS